MSDAEDDAARIMRVARTPRRRNPPRLAACFRNIEQHDIAGPQGNVAAWRLGEGPAILLVHGWEDDHTVWTPMIDALQALGFAIVTLDLPAHGWSDGDFGLRGDCIDAVKAVAAQLGPIESAIGHSMGGGILGQAMREGLQLDRLVVIASAFGRGSRWRIFAERAGIAPEIAERARDLYIAEVGEERGSADVAEILASLSAKKLLVHSYEDEAVPYARAQAAAETSNAPLLLFPHLKHRETAQDRDVVARVLEFMTGA
ncbi:probable hydrolase [alpha proteobacterium U9-1i]|nr:probable hydrolase [alpha proteobacterium U9-1i]